MATLIPYVVPLSRLTLLEDGPNMIIDSLWWIGVFLG